MFECADYNTVASLMITDMCLMSVLGFVFAKKWTFSFKICLWSAAYLIHRMNMKAGGLWSRGVCVNQSYVPVISCCICVCDRDLYILHHCKGLSCKSFHVRSFLTAPRHPLNTIYRVISFMQTRVEDESQSLINYELANTLCLPLFVSG